MSIFGNKKLNTKRIYSLSKAIELAQNSEYQNYEFEPVDPDNIQAGYRIVLREHIETVKRGKRNNEFANYISGNGRYKNMDKSVANRYNDYSKAKRYNSRGFDK